MNARRSLLPILHDQSVTHGAAEISVCEPCTLQKKNNQVQKSLSSLEFASCLRLKLFSSSSPGCDKKQFSSLRAENDYYSLISGIESWCTFCKQKLHALSLSPLPSWEGLASAWKLIALLHKRFPSIARLCDHGMKLRCMPGAAKARRRLLCCKRECDDECNVSAYSRVKTSWRI